MYPADMGPRVPPPPPPEPKAEPQAYTSRYGDTPNSIATEAGVDPADLQAANPQLGSDLDAQLDAGTQLTIPAAPQSVTEGDPITGDPTYPSTDVKVGVEADNGNGQTGSLTWEPSEGKVTLTTGQQAETPDTGNGAQLSVRQDTAVVYGQKNDNGNTQFTVEVQTSASTSASVDAGGKKGGFEAETSTGAGFKSSYQVTLPGENQTPEAAAQVNPYDPTTIPVGGRVTMSSEAFTETSLAGSFRYIGTETKVKEGEGTSYIVERVDENTMRVMMGPTESVEAFNGVGLRAGPDLSLMVGRQDSLVGSTLRTADFDLSTADGQAAYSHFVATGQVAHETAGVDNVSTIERIDYSSQSQLRAKLGPLSVELGGAQNTGSVVQTTYPDGSFALTTDLQYSGNVPLQVTQRFDAQGDEIVSERRYSYTVQADENNEQLLNLAISGNYETADSGPVDAGETVTLTFTEQQMQGLVEMTSNYAEEAPSSEEAVLLGYMESDGSRPTPEPFDFAIALARNLNNDNFGFSEKLFSIADGGDAGGIGDREADPIPMTVETS